MSPARRGYPYNILSFLQEDICYRYPLAVLPEGLLKSTHKICFHEEIKKKYQYVSVKKKKALSGAITDERLQDGDDLYSLS